MAVPKNLSEALTLLTGSTGNPITGLDLRDAVTWLASLALTGASLIQPSGDPSGNADRTAIQAVLTTGSRCFLQSGATYFLDQPLTGVSGGYLGSLGLATLKQGSAWASGAAGAENPANALLKLYATDNVTAATTITTRAVPQASSVGVGSATGFVADKWFKITGTSGADDFYGQSAGANCPADELNRVGSAYVSGTTIPFGLTNFGHHGLSGAVNSTKAVKLLDAIVDGFVVEGIRFDVYSDTSPVVCTGISTNFARNVVVRNCQFKGFIYYAVHFYGTKEPWLYNCSFLGANNGRFQFRSCQWGGAYNCHDRLEVYERINTRGSGRPQGAACWRSQCNYIVIDNCSVMHAVMGWKLWGGINCKARVTCADLDFTLYDATPFSDEGVGGRRGIALDQGGNDIATAEFGHNVDIEIMASHLHAGPTGYWTTDDPNYWHSAFYVHDTFDQRINVRLENLGLPGFDTNRKILLGVASQDSSGELVAHIRGAGYLGRFSGPINGWGGGSRCYFEQKPGSGSPASNLMILEGGGTVSPCFDEVAVQSGPTLAVLFEAYSTTSPTFVRPIIRRLVSPPGAEGFTARNVVIGQFPNSTANVDMVVGRAYLIDSAATSGIRQLITHTTTAPTGDARSAVILSYYHWAAAGATKLVACVELGPGCCAPIKAGAALNPKVHVELNSSGQIVALTNGADTAATLQRWAGTIKFKTAGGDTYAQLGDD